jgi:hypothetical protein
MSINIKLFDNWRIRTDKYNYILIKEINGREFSEGFYYDLESCIQSFINKKIKGFDSTSILGLTNSIKVLLAALNRTLQPLKIDIKIVNKGGDINDK